MGSFVSAIGFVKLGGGGMKVHCTDQYPANLIHQCGVNGSTDMWRRIWCSGSVNDTVFPFDVDSRVKSKVT